MRSLGIYGIVPIYLVLLCEYQTALNPTISSNNFINPLWHTIRESVSHETS